MDSAREERIRSEVAQRLSAKTAALPASGLSRSARTVLGLARVGRVSLGRALGRADEDIESVSALVASIGELKGVSMKLGQLLGYLDAGLPEEVQAALSVLSTRAQPLPFDDVRAVVEADLGESGRALIRGMQPEPISSASIGQVHRATLPDGTWVAVKVLYPGIADAVARDFGPATLTSRLASWIFPSAQIDSFVREIRTRVLEECDYRLEAKRQERFRALFAGHGAIVVPAVHAAYSSGRVLTTTFVEGVHLPAYLASRPASEARNRAAEALFDFYLGSLFRHGIYVCDPHPGNYLFLPDGKIAFLDFGCAREFEPRFVGRLAALTRAVLADDSAAIRRGLVDLEIASDGGFHDPVATRWLVRAFYGPMLGDAVLAFDAGAGVTVREALDRKRRAGHLALPGELLFLLRTTLGLSAVLARLGARSNWHRRLLGLLETPLAQTGLPTEARSEPSLQRTMGEASAVARSGENPAPLPQSGTPAAQPRLFEVRLIEPGESQIELVRQLRELTGMTLRDAKNVIKFRPRAVKSFALRAEAEALARALEALGARIEVTPVG